MCLLRSNSITALFTCFAICFLVSPAQAKYSGVGNGGSDNPYRIADANDMNEIGTHTEDWGSYFVMTDDINLADYTGTQFNIIGNGTTNFTGIFDGNGFTISNFSHDSTGTYYIGIFGYVNGAAQIKNLILIDPNVDAGTGNTVGSLVGRLQNGTIENCCSKGGTISGKDWVGGLAGANFGTISKCYSTSDIYGGNGAIEVPGVGGLVGYNDDTILNCYATGDVFSGTTTGGLVGTNEGTISNCYSMGGVSPGGAGGLVGHNYATVINSFWDTETSGQTWSSGGVGKTTTDMQKEATFADVDWDFIEIWDIGENQTYPYLRVYPAGDLNHNRKVNFVDFAIFADHWLAGVQE